MSAKIREMYVKAGLTPPVGKGEHTQKFHSMAIGIKKSNPGMSMNSAYAIAMSKLGRNKAVKKSHWNPNYRKGK
jgi:hypothetical protein